MPDKKKTPDIEKIKREYEAGITYKQRIGLFETVKQNENFFLGRQWEGVNAPDLEKPVNNIIRRIVTYAISQIVSDDVAAEVKNYPNAQNPINDAALEFINREIEHVLERTQFTTLSRDWIRDAAVDGDACAYFYWNPDVTTGTDFKGAIECESVDNTRVIFGNPAVADVQKQPFLIIPKRMLVEDAKREAENSPGGQPNDITADDETEQPNTDKLENDNQVTVFVRLWKNHDTGTIWCSKSTEKAWVRKAWDTGLELYPVAYFSWDKVKNSYHGQSIVTSVIPNQIAINKLEAMLIKAVKDMAFPKIVYDATKIERWNNRVGEAIATIGDPNVAVARVMQGAAISPQVQQLIDSLMALTKDTMGASDAALGNVRPENTSAIIAIQKAAAAPLELQRKAYYQFVEDCARVLVDMMRCYYGTRYLMGGVDEMTGMPVLAGIDFEQILKDAWRMVTVDVGASAYWSELTQVQTADNLLANGLVDGVTYIKAIPDNYLKNKKEVLAYNERMAAQREAQMQAQAQMAGGVPVG